MEKSQMMNKVSGQFMVSVKNKLIDTAICIQEVLVSSVCCCLFSQLFATDS